MKKILSSILAASFVFSAAIRPAYAISKIETEPANENWQKPTLVYGGGLNDSQKQSVNSLFGISDLDKVTCLVVKGEQASQYLNIADVDTSSLLSSVMVQKKEKGSGVNVSILTPENITMITETQYANAAITAGVADADIEVVSPVKVTGQSALAGVYVAFESNGEPLDEDRTEVAQQELETVNQISEEQAANNQFNSTELDLAIAQIKEDLAEYKEEHGEIASYEDVVEIIQYALKKYNLESLLNDQQISQLVEFAQNYQNTSAIDSKEVLEQLNSFSDTTMKQISGQVQHLQDSGFFDRIYHTISEFFANLWSNFSS